MNEDITSRLGVQDKKLDAIYRSVEKTRKYFLWTLVTTIVLFVLPLIGLAILLPWLMTTLLSGYGI